MAGQTESVTRAVHDDVLDDAKGLRVFVRKQVLWIRQTGHIAQPANTQNHRGSLPNSLLALLSDKDPDNELKILSSA